MTPDPYSLKIFPKIELHLHFEGAIPIQTLWECANRNAVQHGIKNFEEFSKKFNYNDFNHFREIWAWKNRFLLTENDFKAAAAAFAKQLKAQNYVYAEVFISPTDFIVHTGLSVRKIIHAILDGINQSKGTKIKIIVDLVKTNGPVSAMQTLDEIISINNKDIIGIGLGGDERIRPSLFKSVYKKAKNYGLKTTIHAGESLGPDIIWESIKELEVDRVGHAVSAIQDKTLLDYLLKKQLPIELCPTSNEFTRVIPSYNKHPVKKYYDHGLLISINTDDPVMFHTSLSNEFKKLVSSHNFETKDIFALLTQAAKSSWTTKEEKMILIDKISESEQAKTSTSTNNNARPVSRK